MKDPSATHYPVGDDESTFCISDEEDWPCKTWRKWLKSPEYRITTLELRMTDTAHMISQILNDVATLKRDAHRAKLIQDAQMEWLAALGRHTGMAEGIEIDQFTEEIDVSSAFGSVKLTAPGPLIFRVRFGNGEWKS